MSAATERKLGTIIGRIETLQATLPKKDAVIQDRLHDAKNELLRALSDIHNSRR